MKIYLAGKVGHRDWRHGIVHGLAGVLPSLLPNYEPHRLPQQWPIYHHSIFGQHDYVGPYFVTSKSLNHRESHGRSEHGVGAGADWRDGIEMGIEGWEDSDHDLTESVLRSHLAHLCLNSIEHADVVFAWVDQTTAYGTLVELGYARAYSKPIWWAEPSSNYDLDDLWFGRSIATAVHYAPSAKEALGYFLESQQRFMRDGYIYVLQSGQHYKIGKTQNVDNRVAQISPKTPLPVSHIHTIESDDMGWVERWLHQKFANYRTNGEWFSLPPAALNWLLGIKVLLRRNLEVT